MNKDVSYNFNILIKKRKSLKLSIESVSKELILSVDQVKSLESNSQKGFSAPHFQHLSLKKYAEFLDIDLDLDIENQNDSTITNNVDQSVSLVKRNREKNKYILPIILLFFFLIYYLIVFFSNNLNDIEKNTSATINPDNSSIIENQINNEQSNDSPISVNSLIKTPVPALKKNFLKTDDIEKSNRQIDFLCTVKSTATKKFSTQLPEKPPTYFHIISFDKQTICTIDADNNFQEYKIEAGGKVTHRGKAPFKIQLNPNISELYFEGWKVHLQENDNFIQLKPSPLSLSPRNY